MRGASVILKIGGKVVALQTECRLEAQVSVSEVMPLPGSDEDDGWVHYRADRKQWAVSNDSFLTVGDELLRAAIESKAAKVDVQLNLGALSLKGGAITNELQIDAQTKGYARMEIGLTGDGWPELIG